VGELGLFVECRGTAIHSCGAAFDQAVGTAFGDAILDQTIRNIMASGYLREGDYASGNLAVM
jgi:hypothetical protein